MADTTLPRELLDAVHEYGQAEREDARLAAAGLLPGGRLASALLSLLSALSTSERRAQAAEQRAEELIAIETAERWAWGEEGVTLEQVRSADADADAQTETLRECADLVRERIPWSAVEAAILGKETT